MADHYAHFAARLRERCPYHIDDPYGFAHTLRMAALLEDETRVEFVAKNSNGEGNFYRVFDDDGTVLGFALMGLLPHLWPITFYSHDQYRRKRWRAKRYKQNRQPGAISGKAKTGKRPFTAPAE